MESTASKSGVRLTLLFSSAIVPFILYLWNATGSLGFADAAEFALVTKILSTAHPPGFPAYVLFGYLWSLPVTLITQSHIWSMVLFSAACSSAAAVFIFLTTEYIISKTNTETKGIALLAFASSAAFSYGSTVWYWSNSVEVYSLQALALSMAFFGSVRCGFQVSRNAVLLAGTGIGIGLANHHLTMVLAMPFLVMMAYPGLLTLPAKDKKKKGKDTTSPAFKILPIPRHILTIALTASVWVFVLYGWMFWNAGKDFVFEFGNPDTFSRLLYHLAGGAWMENTAREVSGIAGMRLPYFLKLVWWQYLPFLIFIITGIFSLIRKNLKRLVFCPLLYFIAVFLYQLRIDQTSDTDAYLIPAFAILAPFAGIGLMATRIPWRYTQPIIIAALAIHVLTGFQRTDKRTFDVSESLMKMLDESAPENAVILISDWTLVIQYHYYRIAEGFRTDLTVLNYDLKFTNYKSIPVLYPEFYKATSAAYDKFVKLLGTVHPQEIYNTGCTLDSPELMNSYRDAVLAIQRYCDETGKTYMVDPKAFVFQIQNGMMTSDSRVSGCFVSKKETGLGKSFLDLPFKWLDSPITLTEPAATDKLVDFEAMLDFHRNYYRSVVDSINLQKAENSYMRIKALQRNVKRNLPFVFRKD